MPAALFSTCCDVPCRRNGSWWCQPGWPDLFLCLSLYSQRTLCNQVCAAFRWLWYLVLHDSFPVAFSQNDFGWKRHLRLSPNIHPVLPGSLNMCLRTAATHLLNISRDWDSTTSLGRLFQRLTTLSVKKRFLIFSLNLP